MRLRERWTAHEPGSPDASPDVATVLPELLPRLWAFALRLTGDRQDAEDLVQRSCVRALERADQCRPGSSTLSWVFSIMHSTWINELRMRAVRTRAMVQWDDDLLAQVADPSAQTPEQNAIHGQILGAVLALPEKQRVVMLLVAVEGLSYSEAAEVLDVPIGTIMSRLYRARVAIGARFEEARTVEAKLAVLGKGTAL
ncbi:RNA polymerase sigma factor [Paraburkholderia sp. J12]|uniref:RNA polymerase sigma factor n=1 Tax=Paraburkholderia sp. J12 TaxID=2805432 RepID=UPI002ABD7C5B|nr:RNA polymerase sigma factor [Paraburkholderia sp. J12]